MRYVYKRGEVRGMGMEGELGGNVGRKGAW